MVDLQSMEPVFYWTYDKVTTHKSLEVSDDIWFEDALDSLVITGASISFDAPYSWDWGEEPIRLHRGDDGLWRATAEEGSYFEAVHSDTAAGVVLTGIWRQPGYRGAFIAVLPKHSADG